MRVISTRVIAHETGGELLFVKDQEPSHFEGARTAHAIAARRLGRIRWLHLVGRLDAARVPDPSLSANHVLTSFALARKPGVCLRELKE